MKYTINPSKIQEFEHYGEMWIDLVNTMGGFHHGYLIPHEGLNNIGYASFSFPSLAEYESYRNQIPDCPKCQLAMDYLRKTECVLHFERNFFKPVFDGHKEKAKLR